MQCIPAAIMDESWIVFSEELKPTLRMLRMLRMLRNGPKGMSALPCPACAAKFSSQNSGPCQSPHFLASFQFGFIVYCGGTPQFPTNCVPS